MSKTDLIGFTIKILLRKMFNSQVLLMFQEDKMKFFAVEMIQEFGTVTNPKIFLKLKQVYLNFVSHIMVKLYSLEWEISTSLAQLLYTKLRKINQEML